jgi:hypothetical protein
MKTLVENMITLHPIAQAILNKRKARYTQSLAAGPVFYLPTANRANKILDLWCSYAGITKHITWHSARLSFSILLQDANIDAATVSYCSGTPQQNMSTRYIEDIIPKTVGTPLISCLILTSLPESRDLHCDNIIHLFSHATERSRIVLLVHYQ